MIMHKNADKVCPMDSVAQWIRHRPTEPGIAGSSPAGFTLPAHTLLNCTLQGVRRSIDCICQIHDICEIAALRLAILLLVFVWQQQTHSHRAIPAIAQLVEHLTVDSAGIRWSLVRFRVAGFSCIPNVTNERQDVWGEVEDVRRRCVCKSLATKIVIREVRQLPAGGALVEFCICMDP